MTRPVVGEIYTWAGKVWEVVQVDEASQTADVQNTARLSNTARMPWAQFRPLAPDFDPVDDVEEDES